MTQSSPSSHLGILRQLLGPEAVGAIPLFVDESGGLEAVGLLHSSPEYERSRGQLGSSDMLFLSLPLGNSFPVPSNYPAKHTNLDS